MKSDFLSGCSNRQAKIEAAIRSMLSNGYTKEWISDAMYNIGVDKRDTQRALDVVESEALEADLQQAAEAART